MNKIQDAQAALLNEAVDAVRRALPEGSYGPRKPITTRYYKTRARMRLPDGTHVFVSVRIRT